MRIYAICGDENLSDNDARLLSYMHAKAFESGIGIEYFKNPSTSEETALSFMTGEVVSAGSAPEGASSADSTSVRATEAQEATELSKAMQSVDRKLEEIRGLRTG